LIVVHPFPVLIHFFTIILLDVAYTQTDKLDVIRIEMIFLNGGVKMDRLVKPGKMKEVLLETDLTNRAEELINRLRL